MIPFGDILSTQSGGVQCTFIVSGTVYKKQTYQQSEEIILYNVLRFIRKVLGHPKQILNWIHLVKQLRVKETPIETLRKRVRTY